MEGRSLGRMMPALGPFPGKTHGRKGRRGDWSPLGALERGVGMREQSCGSGGRVWTCSGWARDECAFPGDGGCVCVCVCVCTGRRKVGMGFRSWILGAGRTGSGEVRKGMTGFSAPDPGDMASARAVKKRVKEKKPPRDPGRQPAARRLCRQPAFPQAARNSGLRIAQLPLRRPSQGRTRFRCKRLPPPPGWGLPESRKPTGCSPGFRVTPAPDRV